MALWGTVLLPLVVLSVAPHQEPRFLLPAAVPLAVLVGPPATATRARRALWVLFNLAGEARYQCHVGNLKP